jgi:hypothetical protein
MRRGEVGLLAVLLGPGTAVAQHVTLTGYGLNVVVGSAAGPFTPKSVQDALRLRLMAVAGVDRWSLDLAYEHGLTVTSASGATALGALVGAGGGRGDVLPLQGTLDSAEHAVWRHRLDRASLTFRTERIVASAGRQTISWATTLFLTPADPFAPFDPADPFRDYRLGVDAARVRVSIGTMGEVDAAARVAVHGGDTTVTALARARASLGSTDVTGWGGLLHDQAAFAVGLTTIVLDAAVRAEATLRPEEDDPVLRVAVGADRSFTVAGRMLYAVLEYQYDGYGASSADGLLQVARSPAFRRGELQVLGRHEVAAQLSYQLHPLIQVAGLGIGNVRDGSVLLTPSLAWDAGREVSLRVGVFVGLGADVGDMGLPGSEYGPVPVTGYVSGTVYF